MPCARSLPRPAVCFAAACSRQRGAAILLALVTVFFAASIGAALLANLGRAADLALSLQDQREARLLARGAVDWARNVLAEDARVTAVDHNGEPWAVEVPPTPIGSAGEGEVSGQILDHSGRFNINNIAANGEANAVALEQFERLLATLEISPGKAQQLARAAQAWMLPTGDTSAPASGQKIRPPHGDLIDIRELAQVEGFDEALVARLAAFAFAAPAPSKINLNTAPPEVLVAVTRGLDLPAARIVSANRERAWYRSLADYQNQLAASQAQLIQQDSVDTRSRYFLVVGRARYGGSTVQLEVLLDRANQWAEILWQKIL